MCSTSTSSFILLFLILSSSIWNIESTSNSPSSNGAVKHGGTGRADFSTFESVTPLLKSTIEEVLKTTELISSIGGFMGDFRLSNALQDCTEVLDYTTDELDQSMTAMLKANSSATTSFSSASADNLRSWLSAAMGNQDTCIDGFEGTDGIARGVLVGVLDQVSMLVSNVLAALPKSPSAAVDQKQKPSRRLLGDGQHGFPSWLPPRQRRLLQAAIPGSEVDVVVAQDGSGNFTTVSDAVEAAPTQSSNRFVIYVRKGVYVENVEIKKKKMNLMIIGEGMGVTVISGSRSYEDGWTTFRSATFAVSGAGFIARDITFQNTAGPEKHQAVAARIDSDLSVFYHVSFEGYQDTLYAHSLRQFYRECLIYGTVDFIFGNAAAVIQNSYIHARKPLATQKVSVTAQGRKDPNQNTGFSLQFCNVTGEYEAYLGRPWKQYSTTVFMQSYLDGNVRPEGWLPWNGDYALSTLYYGEYLNNGPGSNLSRRVNWGGYHMLSDSSDAMKFTVAEFIDGNNWLPSTGVKFAARLSM